MTLAEAQALIVSQKREIALKENQIAELTRTLEEFQLREQNLKLEVDRLLKRLYGPKSEAFKADPNQLLFDELLASVLEQGQNKETDSADSTDDLIPPADIPAPSAKPRRRHKHGRLCLKTLEDVLQCEEVIIDVDEEEKICPESGKMMVEIGRDVTRKLEIIPGRIIIKRYIRPKLISPKHPEVGVVQAQLPMFPIPKCKFDVGLIADILVSKYMDHKPLYRIERSFSREGVHVSRSTMSDIAVRCGVDVLFNLYRCLVNFVLSYSYIFSDDTRLPIQVQNVPLDCRNKELGSPRVWVYGNVEGPRQVVYDFTLSRRKEGPENFLSDYRGYLQADAYAGYDVLYNQVDNKVIEVGCMAHARRKFDEAMDSSPIKASEVLGAIQELFLIERRADEKNISCPVARLDIRHEHSKPIIEALFTRMEQMQQDCLPKSPIATALGYAINQRVALQRFLEDGRLRLDNNLAENHMRPIALGRKNYLTVGSKRGGIAAAVIYSFTESCRLVDVNPVHYFKDVLWRIEAHPPEHLSELLPCNWQRLEPPGNRIIMPPMPRRGQGACLDA